MNAVARLGRLVIERVRGIGVATLMLLQIIFSLPTAWGKTIYLPDVPGWGDVAIDYYGLWTLYWTGIRTAGLFNSGKCG